jgi:hypothetical protein
MRRFPCRMLKLMWSLSFFYLSEEKVGENSEDQILRSTILKLCSNAGDTDLINILLDKFWKFIDEGVPLDPSLKRTIYAVNPNYSLKHYWDKSHIKCDPPQMAISNFLDILMM